MTIIQVRKRNKWSVKELFSIPNTREMINMQQLFHLLTGKFDFRGRVQSKVPLKSRGF